jgi:membrane protein YqaA with SNARE-associated domain
MKRVSQKFYDWGVAKAQSPHATTWLGVLFFLEVFLFLPLDAILVFFCLQTPKKTPLYAFLAAIASTFSALMGYAIGYFLWDLIGSYVVPHLISASLFQTLSTHLQDHEGLAVFIGAFAPLPMKAISLTSGVFHLALPSYLAYIAIARLCRFFLIGGAMNLWGEKGKLFLEKHFHRIVVVIGAKIALAVGLFWALTH